MGCGGGHGGSVGMGCGRGQGGYVGMGRGGGQGGYGGDGGQGGDGGKGEDGGQGGNKKPFEGEFDYNLQEVQKAIYPSADNKLLSVLEQVYTM